MSGAYHTLPGPNPLARTGEFAALRADASDSASYFGNVCFDVAAANLDGPRGAAREQKNWAAQPLSDEQEEDARPMN
jgi:hypothetical protein